MLDQDLSTRGIKRRACDECRLRKLACSKEINGCDRCIREKIKCQYSEQKIMGRPRKRQRGDELQTNKTDQTIHFNLEYNDQEDELVLDPNVETEFYLPPIINLSNGLPSGPSTSDMLSWRFGNRTLTGAIDFGNMDSSNLGQSSDTSLRGPKTWSPFPAQQINNTDVNTEQFASSAVPSCSCLDGIYLSMSSLREISTDISASLITVRAALHTAQTVIKCSQCGAIALSGVIPPIYAFQNAMLLGTLFPTIIEAYKHLLRLVDEETNRANFAGTTIVFRLRDYGGNLGLYDTCCGLTQKYENLEMDPDEWRTTVRALLRGDIYGTLGINVGLVGQIDELEQRQLNRTAQIKVLTEAGLENGERDAYKEADKKPGGYCVQAVAAAKLALQSLVIA